MNGNFISAFCWDAISYRAAEFAGIQMILFEFNSSIFFINFVILQVDVSAVRVCKKMYAT